MMENSIEECSSLKGFQISHEWTEELGMYNLNLKNTGEKTTLVGEYVSILLFCTKLP